MFKKVAFAGLGIALLASPLLASADTASELQARINTLLAQITQLQGQLADLQSGGSTPPACATDTFFCPVGGTIGRTGPNCEFVCPHKPDPVPPPSRICPQIVRNLEQGIAGADVKEVQAYLGVSQTGYFGPQTARAVTAFQADEGLTQVGIVGPQTRAAFARRCGRGNQMLTASPTSGAAPLTVAFQANLGHSSAPGTYRINFGDGQSGEPHSLVACATVVGGGDCPDIRGVSHTYSANGTYTATLTNSIQSCGGMDCVIENSVLGTVTITVRDSQTYDVTLYASPQSGQAPLAVAFSAGVSNNELENYYIDFGDGATGRLQNNCSYGPGPGGCGLPSATHTYATAREYRAYLYLTPPNCESGKCDVVKASALIKVDGNTTNGPKLVPQSDTAGTVGAPLSIIGTGFTPGNTNNVFFGNPSVPGGPTLAGANLAPMSSGSEGYQQLFFTIPAYIAVGTYPVSVANANGSSGTNDTNGNPVTYRVRTAASISSISPSPAPVGSTITISGKGFDQQLVNVDILSTTGQEMQVSGATPTYNGTQVSITLSADRVPAGQYLVSVRNVGAGTPFGGVASRAVPLTVTGETASPSVSITANGQSTLTVPEGTFYTLAWSSQNVTSCVMHYARSNGPEPVNSSNSVVANTSDQTQMSAVVAYTLTCQSANGPVSKTATVFKTTSPDPTFSASPTSGTAPLTVQFTAANLDTASNTYILNYGDGSQIAIGGCGNNAPCYNYHNGSHTYTSAGTYTATLTQDYACLHTSPRCALDVRPLGTVTITVSGASQPIITVTSPNGGEVWVPGQTGIVWWQSVNAPADAYVGRIALYKGASFLIDLIPQSSRYPTSGSLQWQVPQNSVTGDDFKIQTILYRGSLGSESVVASDWSNAPFSIAAAQPSPTFSAWPTSGTAPLTSYLTISGASSASGYSVNFGDGSSGSNWQADTEAGNTYFMSHTYQSGGTYTATLMYQPPSVPCNAPSGAACLMVMPAVQLVGTATITVSGGNTACEVTDIYAEDVPGYVYYNLFMKVRNLPGANSKMPVVSITGAESWDNLTFSQVGYSSGVTTLQASQTVNGAGINYIMERKYTIRPVSNGTTPITCTPMGGGGVAYPLPISTYPTQTTNTDVRASTSGTNVNLANALSALEAALKAIIAKLGQ